MNILRKIGSLVFPALALTATYTSAATNIHSLSLKTVDGQELPLAQKKGQVLLIVNIATRCGFTGQLDELEKLHLKYSKNGFSVIGVPSNDFGQQTPEDNTEVKKFCSLKYGVTFPITTKASVKGPDKHPLFAELVNNSPDKKEVAWNFEKFLIGKNGELLARFSSSIKPESKEIQEAIEKALH